MVRSIAERESYHWADFLYSELENYYLAGKLMRIEKIGRYKIINELGQGGMATVVQAWDPRFERNVAVKILPRILMDDDLFKTRFYREAKTIAALAHSAIVPIYDFGEEDGQPYIVMRLMSGNTLADKLKEGALSIEESMKIISQLAPALDVAHQHGVIHRDIKPANILFDQYGNAYLSDFGLARVTQASHTLTGENILGTPAYMSPEQIQGDKELDGRSDLYALGIIFFQMLAGTTPYQAPTPAKLMMMHVLEPIPDLSTTGLDVSPALEFWFEKALAKDPEERFASAPEMYKSLEAAMQGCENRPMLRAIAVNREVQGTTEKRFITQQDTTLYGRKLNRVGAFILGGIILLISIFGAFGLLGKGPLSMIGASSPPPSATLKPLTKTVLMPTTAIATLTTIPPTATQLVNAAITKTPVETLVPTETLVPIVTKLPETPSIGGADKVAFLNENDVWVVNIDGTELQQLTTDGSEKADLSWDPDGKTIYYISGKCIWGIELASGRYEQVTCFETTRFLEAFVISPDGSQVAISLNRELFVVPFDKERLREARYRSDLRDMSECAVLSPWLTNSGLARPVEEIRWSNDMNSISVLMLSPRGGIQGDVILILHISECDRQPNVLDELPSFEVDQYKNAPILQNFTYDGSYFYAFTSYTRNDGYGYLYFYNAEQHKPHLKVDPIGGGCCYRDPVFSPNNRYLMFAYQPFEKGAKAELYYIPYATVGTGAIYEPFPLPDNFFSDPKAKPQPALRPVYKNQN